MTLAFLQDATNAVLIGPNGVGESTLAQNLAYQALINGHTVLFTSAGQLLGALAALDSDSAVRGQKPRATVQPTLEWSCAEALETLAVSLQPSR